MGKHVVILSVVLVLCVAGALVVTYLRRAPRQAQVANVAQQMTSMPAGSPQDQMVALESAREAEYRALIARAKAELPEAKRRFRAGLPAGQHLFVTTHLRDPGGGVTEQIFVQVVDWPDEGARGVIASQLKHVRGVKYGDLTMVADEAILDWTISHPDGTEEGNALGKFLEQPTGRP